MTIINNGQAVVTGPVTVLWDGITRPEQIAATADQPAGVKYSVKFAAPPSEPAVQELRTMLDAEAVRAFPTGKPRNFQETFGALTAGEYEGKLTGQLVCTATTYNNPPPIYDAQGRELAAASCGLFAGAKVRLILTPRIYNAKGNVGASTWLSGIQIIDLNGEKLAGAGMSAGQVASAFGIQGGAAAFAQPAAAPAPTPAAPLAPNPGIVPPVPTPKLAGIGQTVESMQAAGWTVEQMRAEGYVV